LPQEQLPGQIQKKVPEGKMGRGQQNPKGAAQPRLLRGHEHSDGGGSREVLEELGVARHPPTGSVEGGLVDGSAWLFHGQGLKWIFPRGGK